MTPVRWIFDWRNQHLIEHRPARWHHEQVPQQADRGGAMMLAEAHSVQSSCRVLDVAESSFDVHRTRVPSAGPAPS